MDLTRNLSLRNDVLFWWPTICQLVIDISGELAARRSGGKRTSRTTGHPPVAT